MGLEVVRVEAGSASTPDYVVNGDGPGYVVEVKSRNDEATLSERLEDGEVVDGARLLAHDAGLERAARRARKQFRQVDPNHDRFWILWLSLDAQFGADAALGQCAGTVYGIRQCVVPADATGKVGMAVDCCYARPGVFERWPEIDAAIVATDQGVIMLANELSPRCPALRQRDVPRRLGKAVYLPTEREADGSIFIADRDVDRRDESLLRESLIKKYGKTPLFLVDFTHAWAAMKSGRA